MHFERKLKENNVSHFQMFNILLMVVHYFIIYHGTDIVHTFDSIFQQYVKYVVHKYGTAISVFDGYSEQPTTKDSTYLRRTGSCSVVTVYFSGEMLVQSKNEEFLCLFVYLSIIELFRQLRPCSTR